MITENMDDEIAWVKVPFLPPLEPWLNPTICFLCFLFLSSLVSYPSSEKTTKSVVWVLFIILNCIETPEKGVKYVQS